MYTVIYDVREVRDGLLRTKRAVFDAFDEAVKFVRELVRNGRAVGRPVIEV
jgi:hypothetical protein